MIKNLFMILLVSFIALGNIGCNKEDNGSIKEAKIVPAIDTLAMDKSVSPKDDFYHYVNGGWMASHPLPAEYSRYGSFDVLREEAEKVTHEIIVGLKDNYESGSDEEKVYKLYQMSTDEEKLEADGAKPVIPFIEEVDRIATKDDLVDYLAKEGSAGSSYFFSFFVTADQKSSKENLLYLYQPRLIMGSVDYYNDDDAFKKQQKDYLLYMSRIFELSGVEKATSQKLAEQVYNTEKSLSKILYTFLELRDSERNYNKMSMEELYQNFTFPWKRYINCRSDLKIAKELNVAQKDYFHLFDKWFRNTPLEDMKLLVKANILDRAADYLSSDFRKASFDFHSTSMAGITKQKPLWKKAVKRINNAMGDVIGKKYVEIYFPQEAKNRMNDLVDNLKVALGERINGLSWMGDETKEKAHEKLTTFTVKIGYPEKWRTYEDLELVETSLFDYVRSISCFEVKRNLDDLGKPVDPSRWFMNAHEVNAYYNPTTNEICFPAGILQPPFFNLHADDAVNYGGIGVVIGHEMTHGFDDQGSKYDAQGNMLNW